MSVLEKVEQNFFFIALAFILAFGIYQNIGNIADTTTPVVSVVSNSMKHDYPPSGRIGEVLRKNMSVWKFFSPDIGFQRGDIILVKGSSIDEIEVGVDGDVLVYESSEKIIRSSMPPMIHRAVRKEDGTVDTKGDANNGQVKYCINQYNGYHMTSDSCNSGERLVEIEEDITEDQILGEAVAVIPKLGYAKILPTCFFAVLQGDMSRAKFMCGNLI